MIVYFDKNGDVHTKDDKGIVDLNYDALVRSMVHWMKADAQRRKRRRLLAKRSR